MALPARRDATGMKRLALGLLLAAAALYVLASGLTPRHAAWAYVAAFAEAAMVGAVADWFAVTALFRRPLGLPIAHTDIIAANKNRLGENLGQFIATHFLATEQVLDKLRSWDLPGRVAQWLAQPEHAQRLGMHLTQAGRWLLQALQDVRVRGFVADLARRGLAQVDVALLSGQVLQAMTHERRHQQLLDSVLLQLAKLLGQDSVQDTIAEAVAREVKALKYVGLDQVAARLVTRKVVAVASQAIIDMAEQPEHRLRQAFDEAAERFVTRLQHDPALQQRAEQLKQALLAHPALGRYVNQLWDEWLAWLQADMAREDGAIGRAVAQAAATLGQRLAADAPMRAWINTQVQEAAPRLIERYRDDIRRYITARVQAWDARELSAELERYVGRDLQFIRINGTLVGGLVGLLIHALGQLWHWL